jgi:hypothetical protein
MSLERGLPESETRSFIFYSFYDSSAVTLLVIIRVVLMGVPYIFAGTRVNLQVIEIQLRLLVAGFPQMRTSFDPRPDHVGLVVDKVTLGQVLSYS